jgi:cytoskeletal protein RodZ
MRWPFSRKKDEAVVPAEIREYYQTERRERTGIAWLLALGTLIITIGLASILFFGGRWIYRTIADNDDDTNTAQVEQTPETSETNPDTSTPPATEQTPDTSTDNTTNGSSSATSSTNTDEPSTSNNDVAGSSTVGTSQSTTTPVTGPGDLPETGPSDTFAVFVAVSILGFLTHRYILTRQ